MIKRLLGKIGSRLVRSIPLPKLRETEALKLELAELKNRLSAIEARSSDAAVKDVINYAIRSHWRTVDLIETHANAEGSSICPLCGYEGSTTEFPRKESTCLFGGGRLVRLQCPNCDVIFGPQKMFQLDDQMLDLEYRNLYRVYAEGDTTESTIRTFSLLAPQRNGRYLDFGCGGEWSAAIAKLRQKGWDIYGFEPSAANSSAHVFSTWAEVEALRFDGILSHNVLEHLFDPVGTTQRLSRLLQPGGKLVHATPCFEYLYEFTRFHVFFFTGRSPDILAERVGMRIIHWEREGEFIACVLQPK